MISLYLKGMYGCDYLFLPELAILNAALVFMSPPLHPHMLTTAPPARKIPEESKCSCAPPGDLLASDQPLVHTTFRHLM